MNLPLFREKFRLFYPLFGYEAVSKGVLPQERLDNYTRLIRELMFEQEKSDIGHIRYERKRWKAIKVQSRQIRNGKSRF